MNNFEKALNMLTEETVPKFKGYALEHTSNDYPFGRLRTTATWKVENRGSKYRISRTTVDPKTGRISKPKSTVYGIRAKIGIAQDGKAYPIILHSPTQMSIMSGNMKHQIAALFAGKGDFEEIVINL